jgi:hypothetical protein
MMRRRKPFLTNIGVFDSLFMSSFIFPFFLLIDVDSVNKYMAQKIVYDFVLYNNNLIISLQYFLLVAMILVFLSFFSPFKYLIHNDHLNLNSEYC